MYVGSVLGSGILVSPAIAAGIAGPASLVAWILLSLLSYPIGYTFGALAAHYPDAGGLSAFVKTRIRMDRRHGRWMAVRLLVLCRISDSCDHRLILLDNLLGPIAQSTVSDRILLHVLHNPHQRYWNQNR